LFLCRAISREHAGQPLTLKDIQTARTAHRRALRGQLTAPRTAVAEYLPRYPSDHTDDSGPPAEPIDTPARPPHPQRPPNRPRLHTYLEEKA
jgi:putative transposase